MPSARKRSVTKARKGTAGKKKTAQRESPATKARTKTTGRVKGARGGPAHKAGEPGKTKRESSRRRAAEHETTSNRRPAAPKRARTDITEGDVARTPGMRRARMRDSGTDAD